MVEFPDFQKTRGDLIELLGVGSVGAFDGAFQLGRARWEDKQMKPFLLLAGLLELGGRLAAAVDLRGANGKRHAALQDFQKQSGGGASVRLNDIPTRDNIASGELLDNHARRGTHIEGVNLDQVTRHGDPPALRLWSRIVSPVAGSGQYNRFPFVSTWTVRQRCSSVIKAGTNGLFNAAKSTQSSI